MSSAFGLPYSEWECCADSFGNQPSAVRRRRGVTLIELLITITIIATLSATFLGVSRVAMESARGARTKTMIGKIDGLLMEKWTSYATRRVDIDPLILAELERNIKQYIRPERQRRALGEARADLRLLAVRELMRLEMPDRWSDIVLDSIPDNMPKNYQDVGPAVLAAVPAITYVYRRRLSNLKDTVNGAPLDGDTVRNFQGAECLYMIIMLTTADGEARTLFREQDIGDVDGDGAPEFLDGWGQPISYLRWPAGFAMAGQSSLMSLDADADHDPNDPFRRDLARDSSSQSPQVPLNAYPRRPALLLSLQAMRSRHSLREPISAFRLVPLVYSSGPDGDSDIVTSSKALVFDPYLDYTRDNPGFNTQQPSLGGVFVSDDDGDNWLDNIHNHLQDNR